MKHILTITLLCIFLLSCRAFAQDSFTDDTGVEVAYGQDCQRIVSLMPNLTEMVAFLGYSRQLVGKSSFCNYPDSVLHADDIGGQIDASIEKIVSLQPDIVLAYQGNSLELVEQLRQLGIQVCAFQEARRLEDISKQMLTLKAILSRDGRAEDYGTNQLFGELGIRLALKEPKERPSVFFGYPGELVYTAGTDSFINDVLTRCQMRNVVDIPDRWPAVSAEYIIASDPDWILTTTSCTTEEDPAEAREEMLAELRRDPVFGKLRAIKQGKLIVVNADHLLRPGPRIALGVYEILDQLWNPVYTQEAKQKAVAH